MSVKYLPSGALLEVATITPSQGNVLKYAEVSGGKATVVIPAYEGIAIGHKLTFRVRGKTLLIGNFEIETLEDHYAYKLPSVPVFDTKSVDVDYDVTVDSVPFGASEVNRYTVEGAP